MPEPRVFSFRLGEELAAAFARHQVEYLFIGKAGAIFHGFPDTTQDADVFPLKSPDNGRHIASALRDLGFVVEDQQEAELVRGKAFVQVRNGPFDVDLIFAPDGIETFAHAKRRSKMIDGRFPVASLEDIINSKRAANRAKDRESLPRLEAFLQYLKEKGE